MTRRTYIGTASTPAAATVDTADQGYFLAYVVHASVGVITNSFIGNVNDIFAYQFVLPFRVVVRRISWELTTGVNSSLSAVGLYSADGNSLLVHTGAVSTAIADQGVISTVVTAVTIEPGIYFFAQTSTSTSVIVRAVNVPTLTIDLIESGSTNPLVGIAANSSSSGVLPATLGTITASNARRPAHCVFRP